MAPFQAFIQSGVGLSVMDEIVRGRHDSRDVSRAFLGYTTVAGLSLWAVVTVLASLLIKGVPVIAATLFIAVTSCSSLLRGSPPPPFSPGSVSNTRRRPG
ncbi:MAG: hypothetical protein R2715_20695 [Ilumatobacteraceae bacterium]